MAAAWRAPKTGVGAPKSSVPGPWLASSPQDPRALGAEDTRAGRRGPETAAPSSAGDRPGAGGRAGALERGRPGPGAARPPAAPRAARAALPGVRILGDRAAPRSPLVSPRGPRGRDRSLGRGRLRRGAGQLGLQGGPRQDHGGKIAAEGGGGGRSALGTRRRRQRRSLLLLLLLPPPPARLGVGGGFAGLALRAGGSRGRRLQLLLRRLGRRPAREPRAPSSRTRALLPLRPHGFQNHRPRPLQPVGRRWPRERARAEQRMRPPRATSRQTGGRRESRRGGGLRHAGGICLGGGGAGSSPPRPSSGRGRGQKACDRTHFLGSLRREARKPGRSLLL